MPRRCPTARNAAWSRRSRSEEHTSELQSQSNLVCRLLLEKKKLSSTVKSVEALYRTLYGREDVTDRLLPAMGRRYQHASQERTACVPAARICIRALAARER